VLWEGYSEVLDDGRQRVFGYTPNYLKVASVINNDESVENQTINTKLMTVEENYMVGEIS
jgi:threonylcarbamoyladenosine tRNA methylthiotransferase MtaB